VSTIPPVGQRIREVRLDRGITLRGLARAVGVSPSLVSQIETGKSQPSVSTLYAITKALDISVEDVFDVEDGAGPPPRSAEPEPAAVERAALDRTPPEPAPAPVNADPAADPKVAAAALDRVERRVGPLVKAANRDVLELDSGVTWERLGRVPGTPVDFLLVTYAPGGSSSGTGLLMRHTGVEYGYLISGELTLTLGFDEYKMGPGDAVSFLSTTPHGYRNDGAEPAVGVWFVDDSSHSVH
jgi:transcriptional regulator with XRE-family HTH domain